MEQSTRHFGSMLAAYLGPLKVRVTLLGGLLLAGTAGQLAGPLLLRSFVDDAVDGAGIRALYVIAIGFIAVTAVTQAMSVWAAYLSEQVGWTATNRLRADLVRHCLRLDLPFHHKHSPGEMIERIDGDVTALSNFFSQFVLRIIGGGLLLAGVVILVLYEEWRVGVIFAGFILLSLLALTRARTFAVSHVNDERQASAELYGFVEERLGAVDDIRANGAGGHVMRTWFGVSRTQVFAARRAEAMTATVWTLATTLFIASYLLVLAVSGYLFHQGEITIGTVYLFFQYTQVLRRPLELLADQLKDLQRAGASVGRVQELLATPGNLPEGAGTAAANGAAAVQFDHVGFAYGSDPILSDVSFALAPGEVLGVVGRTGGGKTTLTRLLLRFYDTTAGAVRLDGTDVRDLRLSELRRRVGIVTQDVQLVSGTVRDNLTLYDRSITDERVERALVELGLGDWLRALPRGLDTRLGAVDSGLSAGEAQLLAFARIFLRDPGLVILDEASSRLDPATERLTEIAVSRLLAGRTGIVIAHRLHTVERADRVLVLDHGRVAELGERRALESDPTSHYARLVRAASGAVAV